MACLEFKKVKTLNAANFKTWIVDSVEAHQGRVDAADDDDEEYDIPVGEKNVHTLLSQATHYAIKFKTPFIALFDYQTLILLVMDKASEKDGDAKGGDFTYMTVISDSTQFRKAFLGFLLTAHQHRDRDSNWKKARDGTDIFATASNLGSMSAGGGAGSSRRQPRGGPVSYGEPSSSGSSQPSSQGSDPMQLDNMRRAAKNAPAAVHKPAGLVKSNSGLSTTSTTSSATTVSSAGSRGAPVKGHAAPAVAAPSGTKTASIPVRPKPEASKTETKPVAANKDAKVMNKDAKVTNKDAKVTNKDAKVMNKDAKSTVAKNKATPVTSR